MKDVRVYFVGAHATGKTTLARYVSRRFGLPLLTEVARSVLAERELTIQSLRSDLEVVDAYQSAVFQRQVAEESKHQTFVSDRSFDNLAYAAQHARILHGLIDSAGLECYVQSLQKEETIIFFVRPSQITLKDDGVRESVAWDDVIAIDACVKFMLEMWGLRYFTLSMSSLQERARLVDAVLGMTGLSPL